MKGAFTSAVFSAIAISLLMPLSATAQFGTVSINGEPVDPEMFVAYKTHAIPDEQICYPNTDQLVTTSVIERLLIIDAGRAAGYASAQLLEAPPEAQSDATAEDLHFRYAFLSAMLFSESEEYVAPLLGDAATVDAKQEYLKRLAADDPLLVNVTMVRAAHLQFNTRTDAAEVLARLENDESIDAVAGNLGYASARYNQQKSDWWHVATLPELDGGDAPVVGSLFGPFYGSGQWRIGKVLESKKLPVMLFDDRTQPHAFMSINLREKFEEDNYNALVMDLWASASIELDGKPMDYPGHSFCNQPILSKQYN